MNPNTRTLLFLLCLFQALAFRAQTQVTTRYLAWGGLLEQATFSEKWNATLDLQARYEYTDGDWFAFIVRPGVSYIPNKKFIFTAGTGYFLLYPNPNDKPARPEWRPWQEVGRKFKTKSGTFYPRIRAEQRFIREYAGTELKETFDYHSLRFRLRCDWSLPLGKEPPKGPFITAGNEFFFAIRKGGFSVFDQNRAYVGAGYRFSPAFAVQLNYLFLYQQFTSSRFEAHHVARITILHELNFSKKE